MLSSDDTGVYIFEGKRVKENSYRLFPKKFIDRAGYITKYKVEDTHAMKGVRLRTSFTFSAAGTCSPLLITVMRLNDREMTRKKALIRKIKVYA